MPAFLCLQLTAAFHPGRTNNAAAHGNNHGQGRLTADALRHVPPVTKDEYVNTGNGPYYAKAAMSNRAQHSAELQRQINNVNSLFPSRR